MKRIITLILSLSLLTSLFGVTAHAEEAKQQVSASALTEAAGRLKAVGLEIPDKEYLTAGEYIALLLSYQGMETGTGEAMVFAKDLRLGSVAGIDAGTLITYGAALEAAVNFLGFEQHVSLSGGGINGAVSVASAQGISKDINAGADDSLTAGAAAVILSNMLDVRLPVADGSSVKIGERTVLEKYFDAEEKKLDIIKIDRKKEIITAYENGRAVDYNVSEGFDFDGITIGRNTVFINKDNEICYVKISGSVTVFYDFLYEVNGSDNLDDAFYPSQLREFVFYNTKGKYKLSENAVIYYNDKPMEEAPHSFKDCFARIAVINNEIAEADIYSLYEGGLITTVLTTTVKYTRGETTENILKNFDTLDNLTVIIDGKKVSGIKDLSKDMVFDFWIDGEETSMVIAASSRRAYGVFSSYNAESVQIEQTWYKTSDNVYTFSDYLQRYEPGSVDTVLGKSVYGYIDDRCEIRYIREDGEVSSTKIVYGVVERGMFDNDTEKRSVKLIPISESGTVEETVTYPVKDKLAAGSFSFDYVKSVASDLNGKGFLKFTLDKNDEIFKMEPVEYLDKTASITSSNIHHESSYAVGGFFMKYATILVPYDGKDGFTVKTTTWEKLRDYYFKAGSAKCTLTVDYDPYYNPLPRWGILTGDIGEIELGWTTTGFVTEIVYREDDCKISFASDTYVVSKEFIEDNGIKTGCMMRVRHPVYADEVFEFEKVVDLSGDLDTWNSKLKEAFGSFEPSTTSAVYEADKVLFRNGDCIQFEVDGAPTPVYGFGDKLSVYEICDGDKRTIKRAELEMTQPLWFQSKQAAGNVPVGDRVWFRLDNDNGYIKVGTIWYCNDESVYSGK
ncbi:MAG: hypothetical protein J6N52_06385 [Clostridia bacterium]|nr:hypothetical protein [Clostridia bacterium]